MQRRSENSDPLGRQCACLYQGIRNRLETILYDIGLWKSPSPGGVPHGVKRRVIREYANKHRIRCFIETGTHRGDMLVAMGCHFDQIHSIELSEELYRRAKQRLAFNPRVCLYCGDSGQELEGVLSRCEGRAIFWLDAHYSGGDTARASVDTPIMEELHQIFSHPVRNHIILIDDARLFTGQNGYPTIDELRNFVALQKPEYDMVVEQDIIRLTPRIEGSP